MADHEHIMQKRKEEKRAARRQRAMIWKPPRRTFPSASELYMNNHRRMSMRPLFTASSFDHLLMLDFLIQAKICQEIRTTLGMQ